MTTQEKLKIDDLIMKKLEANNVRRPICLTNKGALELCIRKGETQYYLTLDSVPCEKELNRDLMDILFKPEVICKETIKVGLPIKSGKITKVK